MNPTNERLSRTMANSLYSRASEGVMYSKKFEPPKWGYMVLLKKGPSFTNLVEVDTIKVAEFVEWNLGLAELPLVYFQGRIGPRFGKVYFRIIEQFARLEVATKAAKERGYSSIWDVENEKEIKV